MVTLTRLRRLLRDRRGNALIIAGAGLPMLVAAAGLGVDTFALSVFKRQLQRAADSGAIAAAYAKLQSMSVQTAVENDTDINRVESRLSAAPTVEVPYSNAAISGNTPDQQVRVRLSANGTAPFIYFFLRRTMALNTQAVARIDYEGNYCLVALDDTTSTGIELIGNTRVTLGCGMATNSRSSTDAISAGGSSQVIDANPLAAMGYIPPSTHFQGTTVIQSYAPKQTDPLAKLAEPDTASVCASPINPNGTFSNVVPGGCYTDFTVHSHVPLAPGTYYIQGDIKVNGGGSLTGTGVTLVLVGSTSDIQLNGGGKLTLTPPLAGSGQPYIGTAIYRSRTSDRRTITLNGNGDFTVEGNVYMPTADVTINGGDSSVSTCLQMVAMTFKFNGNSSISNSCPGNPDLEEFKAPVVRLVL